jgi:hypothetical protein
MLGRPAGSALMAVNDCHIRSLTPAISHIYRAFSPLSLGRGAGGEGHRNCRQYSRDVSHHVVVPESHDAISPRLEEARPRFVMRGTPRMLTTIDLDDQRRRDAQEIDNVWPGGNLATEFRSL